MGFTAVLPMGFYEELLRRLIARGDVEFITYDDLHWIEGDAYDAAYPGEWASWGQALSKGEISKQRAYVLIQHDTDSAPIASIEMLDLEAEYGIRSSTMVFNKWTGPSEDGAVRYYEIDWEKLCTFERLGFVIGYHCNAFHNTGFREEGLFQEFEQDIDELRTRFNIRFFSPHGGRQDDHGRGNASFEYPKHCTKDVTWVHNRYSPRFNRYFSDGGLISRMRVNDAHLDFLKWVDELEPGGRYRMLIHPQYFSWDDWKMLPNVTLDWYREAIYRYANNRVRRHPVTLAQSN